MVRTIDTETAKVQLEHLVEQARDRGDSVIIERDGRPAAALVPLQVWECQERARQSFREALHAFQAGLKTDLTEAEVGELIDREVASVRQEIYEQERAREAQERDHQPDVDAGARRP